MNILLKNAIKLCKKEYEIFSQAGIDPGVKGGLFAYSYDRCEEEITFHAKQIKPKDGYEGVRFVHKDGNSTKQIFTVNNTCHIETPRLVARTNAQNFNIKSLAAQWMNYGMCLEYAANEYTNVHKWQPVSWQKSVGYKPSRNAKQDKKNLELALHWWGEDAKPLFFGERGGYLDGIVDASLICAAGVLSI